jgi:putative flippase GtrA
MTDHGRVVGEFIRFCLTGLFAVILNNLIIVGLTEIFGIHYLWSIMICFFLTTLIGFLLNRHWSFRLDGRSKQAELVRYTVITLIGISAALAGTWTLVERGIPYYVATLGIAAMLAPLNFLLHRAWSFGLGWSARVERSS